MWHDIVVTGQHHGCEACHEFGSVGNEALKPGRLVIEFRSRLRIPIGEAEGSDQDSLNSRFNVASLDDLQDFPASLCKSAWEPGFAREWPRRSRNAPLARPLRTRESEGRSRGMLPALP